MWRQALANQERASYLGEGPASLLPDEDGSLPIPSHRAALAFGIPHGLDLELEDTPATAIVGSPALLPVAWNAPSIARLFLVTSLPTLCAQCKSPTEAAVYIQRLRNLARGTAGLFSHGRR